MDVIGIKKVSILLALCALTLSTYAGVLGDINKDGRVSIGDVTLLTNILQREEKNALADLNADGKTDRQDLDELVRILLSEERTYGEHDAVDLGLSVMWATCNLGASSPDEVGYYYAWGELTPKDEYSEETYEYYQSSQYTNIGSNIGGTKYDAATATWGSEWKMPTLIDINQLMNKCTWTETTQNEQPGYLVTGPNGNSIFLPMTGSRQGTEILNAETNMYYWCCMSQSSTAQSAYCLNNSGYSGAWSANRTYGFPIRPVKK